MGEYKGDMRGWGTSDRSGEGGEKLCIRERWENEHSFEKKNGIEEPTTYLVNGSVPHSSSLADCIKSILDWR